MRALPAAASAFLIAAALAPGAAAAQAAVPFGGLTIDPSAPVEISADTLEVDQETGEAVFTGAVTIGQDEMRLTADRVDVTYAEEAGRIARLIATGDVTLVSGTDAAEGDEAVYDVEAGTVTMTGDVLLTQGASAASADTMRVDLATGRAVLEGRVRTVLQGGALSGGN